MINTPKIPEITVRRTATAFCARGSVTVVRLLGEIVVFSIVSYDGHNFGGPENAELFARCAEAAKAKLLETEGKHG